jgi:hypothetical protein
MSREICRELSEDAFLIATRGVRGAWNDQMNDN